MYRRNRLKDTLEATNEWKQPKLYDSDNMKNRLVDELFFFFFLPVTSYLICKQL